jgi:hypothetical protein
MDESLAAMVPNCRCNPRRAAVRVSDWDPGDELEAAEVVGCVVEPDDGCGGEFGGTMLCGAAEVWAMGSDKATDTKLLCSVDLRRWYEWKTGGRGEGPRRRRCSDAVLTAGVQALVTARGRQGRGDVTDCRLLYCSIEPERLWSISS